VSGVDEAWSATVQDELTSSRTVERLAWLRLAITRQPALTAEAHELTDYIPFLFDISNIGRSYS
jgi:hypothetical protein